MSLLSHHDAQRFMTTYQQVAIALSVLKGKPIPVDPPLVLARAREQLQEIPALLNQAVAQMKGRGIRADPEVVEALGQMRLGEWVHLKDLKSGSVLIDIQGQEAYCVTGLTQPLGKITGRGACLLETALCPFAGRIVCDGIVIPRCDLGSNLRRNTNDLYRNLKAAGRLHQSPTTAALWNQPVRRQPATG
jgi:hypothetical protein